MTYTAWITTDPTCLTTDFADVVVLPDADALDVTTFSVFSAYTNVNAVEGDLEDAQEDAERLLLAAGWKLTGPWETVDTGAIVTVEQH